jgi:hypothetical protein
MSLAGLRMLGLLLLAGLLPVPRARAAVRDDEVGPRLILPGSHAVQPGQVVVLEWTATDRVTELEILLSLDGGRTYPRWISPQLHAGDRRFVWRVPFGLGSSVRMRIRYNRGGREIEGAPSASVAVGDSNGSQPLGLPLTPEDSARPASSGERDGNRSLGADSARRPHAPDAPRPGPHGAVTAPAASPSPPRHAESSPAFVPLRA